MLKRSKGAPISIAFAYPFKSDMHRTVLSILKDMSRISHLSFTSLEGHCLELVTEYLASPARLLRSLRVTSTPNRFNADRSPAPVLLPRTIFQQEAPLLRTVILKHCAIDWDSGILTDLTHLHVNRPASSLVATFPQILAILQKTPLLEVLGLERALEEPDGEYYLTGSRASHPVHLPKLSRLTLTSSAQSVTKMLHSILVPPSAILHIKAEGDPVSSFNFLPLLNALDGCGCPTSQVINVSKHGTLVIEQLSVNTLLFGTSAVGGPHLILSLGYTTAVSGLRMMIQNVSGRLPHSHIRGLQLEGIHLVWFTLEVFDASTAIVSIQLDKRTRAFRFLRSFCRASANGSSSTLVFPRLHTLSLSCAFGDSQVVRELCDVLAFRAYHHAPVNILVFYDDDESLVPEKEDVERLRQHVSEIRWRDTRI